MGEEIAVFGRMAGIVDCFAALTNHRPYAAAVSSYEALRNITAWGGDFFHEPLVQQFVSSVGVFPVGSLIELNTGEVAVVVEHSKVRRLKPRVLVVTGHAPTALGLAAIAQDAAHREDDAWSEVEALAVRARARLELAEPDAAIADLRHAAELATAHGLDGRATAMWIDHLSHGVALASGETLTEKGLV